MIKPKCDKCGEELKACGALAFSPPETKPDESCGRAVAKYHICADCWPKLVAWMQASNEQAHRSAPAADVERKETHE